MSDTSAPTEMAAQTKQPTVAFIGNPNTGKSTLFNVLTGLRQKVANYPGVTVEKRVGSLTLACGEVQLVDLPGTYSLAPLSPEEMIVTDALLGRFEDLGSPSAIVVVADASNIQRNLYLVSQILELSVPVIIALNMMDMAKTKGLEIDVSKLEARLQSKVVPIVASHGEGIDALKDAIDQTLIVANVPNVQIFPEVKQAAQQLTDELKNASLNVDAYEVELAMMGASGYAEQRFVERAGTSAQTQLDALRSKLAAHEDLAKLDIQKRYAWVGNIISEVLVQHEQPTSYSDKIDRFVSHPIIGSLLFVFVMAVVFQAVFAWATPLMDLIDAATGAIGGAVGSWLPEGAIASLLTDGVVAGVGSVVIFLPQIVILSAFIILLEDTGYMARAAFLIDRLMRLCGLSGQSFIPMLSSFACAVPGIMATRVIPDQRDRFATILAAPFMTCSARLPVYALLIAAFVPQQQYFFGLINLQGLVLLGLYLLGIVGGIGTAWLLKRTALSGPTPTFLMELPPYRIPNLKSVLIRLLERMRIFLVRAGTVIFTVAVIIWALVYFPHPASIENEFNQQRTAIQAEYTGEELKDALAQIDNRQAEAYLEQSFLARFGKTIEPIFQPLGWDWKVSSAVIASFPAREVVIAVLGTIYAVGAEVDETDPGLRSRIQSATWPDGTPIYTLPMVIGLMIFYAFCLQCAATVATIYRETNSWKWPAFAWVYMTLLGYIGALLVFQIGSRL
ncbi:MAG: ferrous iron transport protein B [Pseudomonadota bacterium]